MDTSRLAGRLAAAAALLCPVCSALAQCTLIVRDTFRLGLRPHGGGGTPRNIVLGESLSGYWPLVPAHTQWSAPNVSGQPTWIWSATSLDPMEVDAQDPSNGTAFGTGHATALLPFSPPAGQAPFKLSIDTVLGAGQAEPAFYGFTSSSATNDNFLTSGALWVWLDGLGNWVLYDGGTPAATGSAGFGQFGSGWIRIDFTYEPASATVSGHVGDGSFGPVAVGLARPLSFVGFEAHGGFFNVVNNLIVATGTPLAVSVPLPPPTPPGGIAVITAQSNAATPAVVFWRHNGATVVDGPTGTGSVISGASTLTLTVSNTSAADAGLYQCSIANECGLAVSAAVPLTIGVACYANCDGSSIAPVLNVNDFTCFLNRFAAGDSYANCDGGTIPPVLNVNDFTCFLNRFAAGCP